MGQFLKKNLVTVLLLGGTLVLAGIAVFTALRLYQLRNVPVAPNVPSSKPAAAEPACTLNFTIVPQVDFVCTGKTAYRNSADFPTETGAEKLGAVILGTETITKGETIIYGVSYKNNGTNPSGTPVVVTDTLDANLDYVDSSKAADGTNLCAFDTTTRVVTCTIAVNYLTTEEGKVYFRVKVKDSVTASSIANSASVKAPNYEASTCAITLNLASPSITPSPTPASCNSSCTQDSDCLYGLVCYKTTEGAATGMCRNNGCKDRTDCNCNTSTPTPTPTVPGRTAGPTVSPTAQPELPEAGISTPTLIGGVAGVLLLLGAILVAL